MSNWLYRDSLPIEDHPMDDRPIITHLCLACGWPMEWTGEYHEFEIDLIPIEEPVFRCVNPDCDDEE